MLPFLFSFFSSLFDPPCYDHRGAGWFVFLVFHFLILSLDLGVTLCFFSSFFRYQWACDDLMFPFLGYFLLFFFSFLFLSANSISTSATPLIFSYFLNILHLACLAWFRPFLFIHPSYFPLSCVFAYPFQPVLCPVRWSAIHRRVYCVSAYSLGFGVGMIPMAMVREWFLSFFFFPFR